MDLVRYYLIKKSSNQAVYSQQQPPEKLKSKLYRWYLKFTPDKKSHNKSKVFSYEDPDE